MSHDERDVRLKISIPRVAGSDVISLIQSVIDPIEELWEIEWSVVVTEALPAAEVIE